MTPTPLEDFETIMDLAHVALRAKAKEAPSDDVWLAISAPIERASRIRAILEEDERRKSEIVAEMFSPITGEP